MAFIHKNITITGRVQGVFFRASAQKTAQQLGITGFIKNQKDGSVYAETEGTEEALKSFLNWCKDGSPSARVEKIQAASGEMKDFKSFEISR